MKLELMNPKDHKLVVVHTNHYTIPKKILMRPRRGAMGSVQADAMKKFWREKKKEEQDTYEPMNLNKVYPQLLQQARVVYGQITANTGSKHKNLRQFRMKEHSAIGGPTPAQWIANIRERFSSDEKRKR